MRPGCRIGFETPGWSMRNSRGTPIPESAARRSQAMSGPLTGCCFYGSRNYSAVIRRSTHRGQAQTPMWRSPSAGAKRPRFRSRSAPSAFTWEHPPVPAPAYVQSPHPGPNWNLSPCEAEAKTHPKPHRRMCRSRPNTAGLLARRSRQVTPHSSPSSVRPPRSDQV